MDSYEHELEAERGSDVELRPFFRALCVIPVVVGLCTIVLVASAPSFAPLILRILLLLTACSMVVTFGWMMVFGRQPYVSFGEFSAFRADR